MHLQVPRMIKVTDHDRKTMKHIDSTEKNYVLSVILIRLTGSARGLYQALAKGSISRGINPPDHCHEKIYRQPAVLWQCNKVYIVHL